MTYSKGYTPGPFPSLIKDRPSIMWSPAEERRAQQLVRKVDAKKAAEKVTRFHPRHSHNFVGPAA